MEELVKLLIKNNVLHSQNIVDAFLSIDRKDFVLPHCANFAYSDTALPIGYGQTISQPAVVAFMLELLKPQKGDKILDVGSGSGYTTSLLSKIVGDNGKVFGVELIPELIEFSENNLEKYNFSNIKIYQADSKILGLPYPAPYDKILVSAASSEIPKRLIDQLKIDGTIIFPIKDSIYKIKKVSENNLKIQKFYGFAFVSLIQA